VKFIGYAGLGLGLGLGLLAWGVGPWRTAVSAEFSASRAARSTPPVRSSPFYRAPKPALSATPEGRAEAGSQPSETPLRQELELAELDDNALATLVDDLRTETQSSRDECRSLEEQASAARRSGNDDEADRLHARLMFVTERRQMAVAALTRASFEQTCRALDDCDGNARSAFFEAAK
jgi:hypothetical protein